MNCKSCDASMIEGFVNQSVWYSPMPKEPPVKRWATVLKFFSFGARDIRFVHAWRCPKCKHLELTAD